MFNIRSKTLDSREFEIISNKIIEINMILSNKIAELESRIYNLELENNDLRNKVLRKIQNKAEINYNSFQPGQKTEQRLNNYGEYISK